MPYSLIISDGCLIALAKSADSVMNEESLIQFFASWYRVAKHHPVILACLQSTIPNNDDATFMIERKAALKVARAFKKVKYMDNPVAVKNARITASRDQWLRQQEKANAETKTGVKKLADTEKKEKKKADKARERNQ